MFEKNIIPIVLVSALLVPASVQAQDNISEFSPYWKHRESQFRVLPNPKGEICFLGDSITDGCNWTELTGNMNVTNRGISGDTTWGVLKRLDEVTAGAPSKVFLMIGINDMAWGKTPSEIRDKIDEIITAIQTQSPETQIYLESVLPVIESKVPKCKNSAVAALDEDLVKLADKKKITYVDLASLLKGPDGQLNSEYTEDGLHLNGKGYIVWHGEIEKYLE